MSAYRGRFKYIPVEVNQDMNKKTFVSCRVFNVALGCEEQSRNSSLTLLDSIGLRRNHNEPRWSTALNSSCSINFARSITVAVPKMCTTRRVSTVRCFGFLQWVGILGIAKNAKRIGVNAVLGVTLHIVLMPSSRLVIVLFATAAAAKMYSSATISRSLVVPIFRTPLPAFRTCKSSTGSRYSEVRDGDTAVEPAPSNSANRGLLKARSPVSIVVAPARLRTVGNKPSNTAAPLISALSVSPVLSSLIWSSG
jgi:hypothetical protein